MDVKNYIHKTKDNKTKNVIKRVHCYDKHKTYQHETVAGNRLLFTIIDVITVNPG